MFNRYWRYYPWGLQLILFILMVFTLASFFTVVIYVVVPAVTGVPLPAAISIGEGSSRAVIRAALLSQALNHMSLFLIPSLLFVYLTHPDVKNYLGLRKPGKSLHWPVVLLLMIFAKWYRNRKRSRAWIGTCGWGRRRSAVIIPS